MFNEEAQPEAERRMAVDEDDAPREKCGVFGIYAPSEDVAPALLLRGGES